MEGQSPRAIFEAEGYIWRRACGCALMRDGRRVICDQAMAIRKAQTELQSSRHLASECAALNSKFREHQAVGYGPIHLN